MRTNSYDGARAGHEPESQPKIVKLISKIPLGPEREMRIFIVEGYLGRSVAIRNYRRDMDGEMHPIGKPLYAFRPSLKRLAESLLLAAGALDAMDGLESAQPTPRMVEIPADHPLSAGAAHARSVAGIVDQAAPVLAGLAHAAGIAAAGLTPVDLMPAGEAERFRDLAAGRAAIDAHLVRARAL